MAPWSGFWERNFFAQAEPVAAMLGSPVVRGAVTGVGLITALAGLAELAGVFMRRSQAEVQEPQPPQPDGR